MVDLNRVARAVLLLPALLIVGLVRLLRPLFLVRFGLLVSGRIGHLTGNTEVYLCEMEAGLHPRGWFGGVDLWAHSGEPCNEQVGRMLGRQLWIVPALLWRVNKAFRGWGRHVCEPEQHDRDIHNLMERQEPHLVLSPQEERWGEHGLRALGIPKGARWVCLIVRDGAYLGHPAFSYHRYRDTDIADYEAAALALAKRGYWVIRMGARVKDRFDCPHERVIDYATNGMRSDFMDIYLAAHCEFAVSTGTGLDAVCAIFRRPICYVNVVPLEYLCTWVKGVAIWKRHFRKGKEMTPGEIYASGAGQFLQAEDFEAAGIELRDNTPEEIEAAVLEMCKCLENDLVNLPVLQQSNFWRHFPTGTISPYNAKPIHGEIRLRIGRGFLESFERIAA